MPETGFRFYGDLGEPVASIDVADLKSVWDMYQDIASQHPGGGVGVDSSLIERVCSPRADIRAVVYRCQMLSLLEMLPGDLLATWKQSGQLQEAVLRVAARIPMGEGLSHSYRLTWMPFLKKCGRSLRSTQRIPVARQLS